MGKGGRVGGWVGGWEGGIGGGIAAIGEMLAEGRERKQEHETRREVLGGVGALLLDMTRVGSGDDRGGFSLALFSYVEISWSDTLDWLRRILSLLNPVDLPPSSHHAPNRDLMPICFPHSSRRPLNFVIASTPLPSPLYLSCSPLNPFPPLLAARAVTTGQWMTCSPSLAVPRASCTLPTSSV